MRTTCDLIPALMLSLLLGACGGGGGSDASGWAALAALSAAGTSTGTDGNGTSTDGNGTSTGSEGNGTGTGPAKIKTLVSVSTEAPGAHCAGGGVRIDAGLDGDANGMLAAGEVSSTHYVCHDAVGASGSLVQMRSEASGANCAAGGKAISVGADGNANGLLEASEIGSTRYVCNSTDGSPVVDELNTLVSIVSEGAGANCVHGGSRVDKGLDSNANGVLDAGEVSATNYVCNSPPAATFPWVDVTGTAVQAQPNTGYIARNDAAQVVVSLPANPAIGDVVRIRGDGLGGWKIAQNPGQAVQTQTLGGMAGASWTARESSRNWVRVASSADGSKLVALVGNGKIYTSTDSGANWTPRESDRAWWGVASSADGSKLVAAVQGGQIYTSTDSGVSWTPRDSNRAWAAGMASSADGSKLVALEWDGRIYTSTDSGANWTARESNRQWNSVASSADGSKLAATVDSGQIYTSTDSGVSWTARESSRKWYCVSSSADGSKLVAVEYGGRIYTSSDSGVSWTARESDRNWFGVASSADGSKLVASVEHGQLYTSSDSGVSWTARESNRYWWNVASSADGSKLVAVEWNIYTSIATTSPGVGGSISGTSTDAIELQYVGDGMFAVLSHQGSLTIQ